MKGEGWRERRKMQVCRVRGIGGSAEWNGLRVVNGSCLNKRSEVLLGLCINGG